MANSTTHVAEIQGLYGPFTMAERVVQKIWLQRDFDHHHAILTDGRILQIRTTGVWNLLGGPDFRAARLAIGGVECTGDVEVHFHAGDWDAHGHVRDAAYDRVALHVVLFPPGVDERPALNKSGEPIPTLVLLPLLYRDLEEYASDDALEALTERDEWRFFAELAGRPFGEMQSLIRDRAQQRWRQKVYFAKLRIGKLGWEAALHHTALEILGYKRNRAPMLSVATRYPIESWRKGVDVQTVFSEHELQWQFHGIRPANQPLHRLLQYERWINYRPDWPEKVTGLFASPLAANPAAPSTRAARKLIDLPEWRKLLSEALTGDVLGGTRFDNLICDGLLPLLSANTGSDLFFVWFHWFVGDVPDQIRRMMPKLGLVDGQMQPFCHGYARGLLGWFLESEARASG
ncbi:MAG TPA: DUF2851 family protein [Lacunisphaera sp.]|jgi:hypothetical protein